MLESDFDLQHFDLFWNTDGNYTEIDKKYGAIIYGEDRKKKF